MVKNSLFVSGVLLLALCGCMPAIKYAGSEYPNSKEGYEQLQRDQDTRILNSISPTDKPFDARALVVLPSQASINVESRNKTIHDMQVAAAKGHPVSLTFGIPPSVWLRGDPSIDEYPPSFDLSFIKTLRSWKPKSIPDFDVLLVSALNDARERDFELTIEALRQRKLFKEVYVTRSDSSETLSLPKCEVTIFLDADMRKQGTIKVGDSKPESIFVEKLVEEMPGIEKRKGTAGDSEFAGSGWDLLEVKQKSSILTWLEQLEKSVGKHLER